MAIELTDDGTMDTVLRCSECGEEMRYNYDPCGTEERAKEIEADLPDYPPLTVQQIEDSVNLTLYDEFVEWAIEDATNDHECPQDSEPTEPEESDLTTSDHRTFYQDGKIVIEPYDRCADDPRSWFVYTGSGRLQKVISADDYRKALRRYMELSQFWPNVWFISDHGNAHLMTLTEDK